MTTKNPRINITFEPPTIKLLAYLVEQEHKPMAGLVAKKLVLEALERHEEGALSMLAEVRDQAKTNRVKHLDAWK